MAIIEQNLMSIIKRGQTNQFKGFIRHLTGKAINIVKMKNPLDGHILVNEIDKILEIINPTLEGEIEWLKELQVGFKLWCNEKVIINRILGCKDDNQYDLRVFEKVIRERFLLSGNLNMAAKVQTDFGTLVELVELGARRFGR